MERIRRDLADPLYADHPVSWVAGRWGLHDAATFSRLFKAEFGESPTAYRERLLVAMHTKPTAQAGTQPPRAERSGCTG